jgi:hypothetical protein
MSPVAFVRVPRVHPLARLVVLGLASLGSTACVERYLRIDSRPAGAELHVNGRSVGAAPAELPFTYYGTVRVDAWTPDRPGVTQYVELDPPWYQRFPFELFAELFDPRTHVDRHEVTIELPEAPLAPGAEVLQRADELRAETR